MAKLILPHKYKPRSYQLPFLAAMDSGATRACLTWHRRSGKDKTCLNFTIKRMPQRIGTYFYFFPTYAQAKKAIWEGRDKDGIAALDHFPKEYVAKKNATDMQITTVDGSIFQLVGTDNIDSIMSTNPVGCVFAEYSLQDPAAWEYVRPILRENGGWAIFNQTPRGNNHGKRMHDMALKLMQDGDPAWFCSRLGIRETGVLTEADMDAERREGMSDDMIDQEYHVSFQGVMTGSIFGKQLNDAEKTGRICGVPWQPDLPVSTWWDIGSGDATAIWFTQDVGREIHVIDYYSNSGSGVGIDFYIKHLQGLPYIWGTHNGPHDIEAKSFAAGGKSAKQVAAGLGFQFNVIPRTDAKSNSINAGRSIMARCYFDRDKTQSGRDALTSYHYHWDDKRKCFQDTPFHDWSSNGADAWQQLGMGHKVVPLRPTGSDRKPASRSGGSGGWMSS